jgi:hypothetical protein
MTRALDVDEPSAIRTTLTSAPFVANPSARAALNVASPHAVGGYVLRIPKLGEPPEPRARSTGDDPVSEVDDLRVKGAFKVIPTGGCHRHARRERLLSAISGGRLTSPGLAGFPTLLTLHGYLKCVWTTTHVSGSLSLRTDPPRPINPLVGCRSTPGIGPRSALVMVVEAARLIAAVEASGQSF